jgi:hypothetical protein
LFINARCLLRPIAARYPSRMSAAMNNTGRHSVMRDSNRRLAAALGIVVALITLATFAAAIAA